MKSLALVAALVLMLAARAFAQQPPPPSLGDGPPPDATHLDQARDTARTAAMSALSADHAAKVNAVLARVKAGQITDLRDAAHQIDTILDPKESQAILAARDKMVADAEPRAPGDGPPPGAGSPPDGGRPPDGGSPSGHHRGMHAMRNDAGLAFLTLSLDRAQLHAMFERPR
jgi:hypothetical protein